MPASYFLDYRKRYKRDKSREARKVPYIDKKWSFNSISPNFVMDLLFWRPYSTVTLEIDAPPYTKQVAQGGASISSVTVSPITESTQDWNLCWISCFPLSKKSYLIDIAPWYSILDPQRSWLVSFCQFMARCRVKYTADYGLCKQIYSRNVQPPALTNSCSIPKPDMSDPYTGLTQDDINNIVYDYSYLYHRCSDLMRLQQITKHQSE